MALLSLLVMSSASRALSRPDAFRVASLPSPESPKSSWSRSSPLVFFCADLAFLGADLPGVFFSSSASSASLSAFLRAASAFLAASSSLFAEGGHSQHRTATSETARRDGGMVGILGWVVHSNTWMVPSWSSGIWWGWRVSRARGCGRM